MALALCALTWLVAPAKGQQSSSPPPVCYFYHGDHLGSTSVVTDVQGQLVDHYQYTFYGRGRAGGASPTALPLSNRFTSQVYDEGTGLYYYNARYYDPELGNFLQPDSLVPEAGDPQSLNRYSYVRNNPLNKVDPSGHGPTNPQDFEAGSIRTYLRFHPDADLDTNLAEGTKTPNLEFAGAEVLGASVESVSLVPTGAGGAAAARTGIKAVGTVLQEVESPGVFRRVANKVASWFGRGGESSAIESLDAAKQTLRALTNEEKSCMEE